MVVLALLMSIAVPGFQDFIRQSRRDDGRHLLLLNAHRLQRCFTLEGVYNGSCVTRSDSKEGYYTLSSTITATTFTLTALPVAGSSQAKDSNCQSFVYDQTGRRTATGADPGTCWR